MQVKLTVLPVVSCPDGNITVEKSLSIQYLKENEIHRNVFSTKIDDCNYIIRSVQPNDKGTSAVLFKFLFLKWRQSMK